MHRAAGGELLSGLRLLELSPREAALYLTLCRRGPVEVRRVGGEARIHRATTYRLLSRLTRRGLVLAESVRPRRYVALPPEAVLRRVSSFLHEEEEVVLAIAEIYAKWASGLLPAASGPRSWLVPTMGSVGERFPEPSVLELLARGRHSLELMFRPSTSGLTYRTRLRSALARLVRSGVHTRLLIDASIAGLRFERALVAEVGSFGGPLEVHHYTPAGAHFYVVDGRLLLRLPALSERAGPSETAVVTDDPTRVRMQVARFEALWTEAATSPKARGHPLPFVREPVAGAPLFSAPRFRPGPVDRPV